MGKPEREDCETVKSRYSKGGEYPNIATLPRFCHSTEDRLLSLTLSQVLVFMLSFQRGYNLVTLNADESRQPRLIGSVETCFTLSHPTSTQSQSKRSRKDGLIRYKPVSDVDKGKYDATESILVRLATGTTGLPLVVTTSSTDEQHL